MSQVTQVKRSNSYLHLRVRRSLSTRVAYIICSMCRSLSQQLSFKFITPRLRLESDSRWPCLPLLCQLGECVTELALETCHVCNAALSESLLFASPMFPLYFLWKETHKKDVQNESRRLKPSILPLPISLKPHFKRLSTVEVCIVP